jgi:hypothetical protein
MPRGCKVSTRPSSALVIERAPRVVNTSSSTAVSSTFEGRNPKPTSRIFPVDIRRLNDKNDGVKDSVTNLALNVEKSFAALNIARVLDQVWWLPMSGALLGRSGVVQTRPHAQRCVFFV